MSGRQAGLQTSSASKRGSRWHCIPADWPPCAGPGQRDLLARVRRKLLEATGGAQLDGVGVVLVALLSSVPFATAAGAMVLVAKRSAAAGAYPVCFQVCRVLLSQLCSAPFASAGSARMVAAKRSAATGLLHCTST